LTSSPSRRRPVPHDRRREATPWGGDLSTAHGGHPARGAAQADNLAPTVSLTSSGPP